MKYFRTPLFQSSTISLAPCFISGTPPLPNFPWARHILAKKSVVEVKGAILYRSRIYCLGIFYNMASITYSS